MLTTFGFRGQLNFQISLTISSLGGTLEYYPSAITAQYQMPIHTRLCGAPHRRVRLTLGFGTRAANLAMKSTGGWPPRSNTTRVVPSLLGQLIHQGRVVRLDELIEKGLLGLMALVSGVAKCMPINRGRLSLPGDAILT